MDIDKYIKQLKKTKGFEDNILDTWINSINNKIKNYKSESLIQYENDKKINEDRIKVIRHDLVNRKRRNIEINSIIEKQKEEDKKSRESILKRIKSSNIEFEKIKSLPIESLITIDSNNDIPIFIATTSLLKVDILTKEELDSFKFTPLRKMRIKKLFDKEIGKFIIVLDFNDFSCKAFNLTKTSHISYDHPCISNGSICFGNKTEVFSSLIREYRLFDCLDLIIDLITSPITGSPYIEWKYWFEGIKKTDIKRLESNIYSLFNRNIISGATALGYEITWGEASSIQRDLAAPAFQVFDPTSLASPLPSPTTPTYRETESDIILENARSSIESRMRSIVQDHRARFHHRLTTDPLAENQLRPQGVPVNSRYNGENLVVDESNDSENTNSG